MSTTALDVVRPGDPRYPGARHVYTATGSPAAVVVPRSADEVAKALAFAREAGAPFAVRSGGHGISSVSTNDGGTVIDLGSLGTVERGGSDGGTDGRTVRMGPGARRGHVARRLYPWGLAISSGDSGDVGRLATTGGICLMGRAHGLTIDPSSPPTSSASARAHTGLADHLDPVLSGRLERLVRDGFGGMVQVRSAGGAVNDVPAEATAYAHRHQNVSVIAVSRHDRAGLDAGWDRVKASMDGIYLSFESAHAPERLRAVKRAWDPDGIFDQNFDVTSLSNVTPLVTSTYERGLWRVDVRSSRGGASRDRHRKTFAKTSRGSVTSSRPASRTPPGRSPRRSGRPSLASFHPTRQERTRKR